MRFVIALLTLFTGQTAYGQFSSFDELQGRVRDAVSAGRVKVTEPTFDWSGATMRYHIHRQPLGCVQGESMMGDLIAELLAIESLHKYRCPVSNKARTFWHSVFPKVEAHARQMFVLAKKANPTQQDEDDFRSLISQISFVYHSELDQLAVREGKSGATNGGMQGATPCAARTIVVSLPAGGSLKYMPNGYYLVWQIVNATHRNQTMVEVPLSHTKWLDAPHGSQIIINGNTRFTFVGGGKRYGMSAAEPQGNISGLRATPANGFTWHN